MANDQPNGAHVRKRRPLTRLVVAGIALGLAGVAVDRLFLVPATQPALLDGLGDDREAASRTLAARVAARYPTGSGEAQLKSDLARQGFVVGADDAKWSRSTNGCSDFAEIGWSADRGRVRATRAATFRVCR